MSYINVNEEVIKILFKPSGRRNIYEIEKVAKQINNINFLENKRWIKGDCIIWNNKKIKNLRKDEYLFDYGKITAFILC